MMRDSRGGPYPDAVWPAMCLFESRRMKVRQCQYLWLLVFCAIGSAALGRPNILFIMSDDHSVNTIGAYGGWLAGHARTPNIDRLAAEGMMLTNCLCTNSLCAPSRASILTGQYSHKNGMYTLREQLDTTGKRTLPVVLQQAGYQTAVIGKWHLHGSNLNGFDHYAITRSQGAYFDPSLETSTGKQRYKGHATDVYTEVSLAWLDKRDRNRPFFLMCHHKAAHGLWQPAKRHVTLYDDVKLPEPETFWDDYAGRSQGAGTKSARIFPQLAKYMQGGKKGNGWPTGDLDVTGLDETQQKQAAFQKYAKDYLRCVAGIDESVGRLVKYLKDEGILQDTLVIYTSDQGMFVGEHGFYDKRLMLDEALKMPFIARYPRAVSAGQISDAIVNNVDFAQTLIGSAGLDALVEMQGRSFWPLLQGKAKQTREASFYAFYSNGVGRHYGIRTKQHKLILYGDGTTRELYDLKADPVESVNQYNVPQYKHVVRTMEARLEQAIKEVDIAPDQLPSAQAKKKGAEDKKRQERKAEL